MTLDESIKDFEDLAELYAKNAKSKTFYNLKAAADDQQTADKFKQLAAWLAELKKIREAVYYGNYQLCKVEEAIEKIYNGGDLGGCIRTTEAINIIKGATELELCATDNDRIKSC